LVNLCWVNNETGVIAPVAEVAKLCQKYGALLHLDAAQAVGKTDLSDIKYADFISLSAHKFYGPKGSGALIIRNNRRITPLFYGGGQEFTLRPGTVATHQIVGLHYALLDTCSRYVTELNTISALSEKMVNCLTEMGCVINGGHRTPFIINAQFPDIDQFAELKNRVTSEFACAAGSACQSSNQAPSHVLTAMGLTNEAVSRSLRFSLGYASQAAELVSFSDLLSQWL
jgi:cysteine desulfurase